MTTTPSRASQSAAILVLIAAAVTLLLIGGLAVPTQGGASAGGRTHGAPQLPSGSVIAADKLDMLTRARGEQLLVHGGWGHHRVSHAVTAWRITYTTVDLSGRPARATGLLALPQDVTGPVTAVAYLHGTTSYRRDVASTWTDPYTTSPAVLAAGRGLAAILPDYHGLGGGQGSHPWLHVGSATTATIDLLRAAAQVAAEQGARFRGPVPAIGFSQGASVALDLHRALATNRLPGHRPGPTFAISGGYDLRGTQLPALLHGGIRSPLNVAYSAYLLVAWNRIWPLYTNPAAMFRHPYAERVEKLFDGSVPGDQMIAGLPPTLAQLLTPAGHQMLARTVNGALEPGLAQAESVCRWTPTARVELSYAPDDEQALAGNTRFCAAQFADLGASVTIRSLGAPQVFSSRHLGTNVAGTVRALQQLT